MPWTRRQFVQTAAVTAAAPMILTSGAAGVARSTRANERLALGIIGMGIRGRNTFNTYFKNNDRCRVVAIAEVDQSRREHYQAKINEARGDQGCDAYADFRELLARDDIDAVVIATPDHWHAIQCMLAAAAGKDIYCEKPLTHTLEEGRRLIEVIRKHECVFQTGSQQRTEYDYRFVKACEYIRNGRIGRILNINVGVGDPPKACDLPPEDMEPGLDWPLWLGPAEDRPYNSVLSPRGVHGHYPAWRAYREYSGGYLADMGAHHFDIAQWGLKADDSGPVEILPAVDSDPMRGVRALYANGTTVTHGGPSGATFIGTDGLIHVDRGRLTSTPGNILDTPIADDEEHLPRHKNHAENWLDCIYSRERPICDVEVGARTSAVCQLINLVYQYNERLAWDPATWRFTGRTGNPDWLDYNRAKAWQLPEG